MEFLKGLYYFNFGDGPAKFISFGTFLIGAGLGYHTKSIAWRLTWSGFNALISVVVYSTHSNPQEAMLGAFSIFVLFQFPFWFGVFQQFKENCEAETRLEKNIINMTELEVVHYIEGYFNGLIGANNGWLKENWHPLTDEQKCEWVSHHRNLINGKLFLASDSIEVIDLMQKWSRFKNAS